MGNSYHTYVYMIRCEDGSIYTGIAKDLKRRLMQHFRQEKECAKYTKSHKMIKLEAAFTAKSRSEAARLEYAIKQLPKLRKEELIQKPRIVKTIFAERLADCSYDPIPAAKLREYDAAGSQADRRDAVT